MTKSSLSASTVSIPSTGHRYLRTVTTVTATTFALTLGLGLGPSALSSYLPYTSAATLCVSNSEISWGVKESFRSYISGSIAKGGWTTSGGATDSGSTFVFTGSGDSVDDSSQSGTITTNGSVNFTGHNGILNLNISNPSVAFSGNSGSLSATVQSNNAEGVPNDYGTVTIGDLTITNLSIDGSTVSGSANVSLSNPGVTAFADFYQAGAEMDPVNFTGTLGNCGSSENNANNNGDNNASNTDNASESATSNTNIGSDSNNAAAANTGNKAPGGTSTTKSDNSRSSSSSTKSDTSSKSSTSSKSNNTTSSASTNKSSASGQRGNNAQSGKLASTGDEDAADTGGRLSFSEPSENPETESTETVAAASSKVTIVQLAAMAATFIAVAGGCVFLASRKRKS